MARSKADKKIMREYINSIYNSTPTPTPEPQSINSGLTKEQIDEMYNSTEIPSLKPIEISNNPTLDELQNMSAPMSQEETYKRNFNGAIAELQNQLADTNAQRTEGETKAIQTYLEGLQGLQAEIDKHNRPKQTINRTSTSNNDKKGGIEYARELGRKALEEAKNGTLKAHGYSLSPNEQRDMQRALDAQKKAEELERKKTTENPHGYALSPNEQRDLQRALEAQKKAKELANQKVTTESDNVSTDVQYSDLPNMDLRVGTVSAQPTPTPTPQDVRNTAEEIARLEAEKKSTMPNKWGRGKDLLLLGATQDRKGDGGGGGSTSFGDELTEKDVERLAEKKYSPISDYSEMSKHDKKAIEKAYKEVHKYYDEYAAFGHQWDKAIEAGYSPEYISNLENAYYNVSGEGAVFSAIGQFGQAFAKPIVSTAASIEKKTGNGTDWQDVAKDYAQYNEDSYKMHPLASTLGSMLGTMTLYSAANGIAESVLGELSPIKNILLGQGIDNILDTFPELNMNYANGKYTNADGSFNLDALAIDFAKSNGINLVGNVLGEVINSKLSKNDTIPTLENARNADEIVESMTKEDIPKVNADAYEGILTKEEIDELLNNTSDVAKSTENQADSLFGDDFLDTFKNEPKIEPNNVPKVDDVVKPIDEIPTVKNIDDEIRESAIESQIKGTYKDTKVINKELDDNINTLVNMFGDGKTEQNVVTLKELLNEYAQTGDETTLAQARQLANQLDEAYSSAKYVSKRGVETAFDSGYYGTFTNQVDEFANRLRNVADIRAKEMPHLEDISKRIDDMVNDYGATDEMVKASRKFKQDINNLLADPSDENFAQFVEDGQKMYDAFANSEKYKSKYRGKTKADAFTGDEIMDIAKEAEEIFTNNNGKWKNILDDINAKALENAKTPGGKVSTIFDNTFKNSGFADEDMVEEMYKYADSTEKASMENANTRVNTDFEACEKTYLNAETVATKEDFNATDVDTMMMMWEKYKALKSDAIASGDMVKAQEIQNKINSLTVNLQRKISRSAQQLQALTKWTRDADGAITAANVRAIKNFTDADLEALDGISKEIYNKINELKQSDLWEELVKGEGDTDKLADEIKDIIQEAVDSTKSKKIAKKMDRKYIRALSNQIADDLRTSDDIERVLEQISNINGIDIKTEQTVRDLFEQAKQLDFNSKKRVELENEAYSILANSLNLTGTFMEKVDAWRYFSMLSGFPTHERNMIGNLQFGQITNLKDNIKAGLEKAWNNILIKNGKDPIRRTTDILHKWNGQDTELYKLSKGDADNIYRIYKQNGRYLDPGNAIDQAKKKFKNDNWFGKGLNWATEKNEQLLDTEDWFFFKQKYGDSLSRYLKANGYDESIFKSVDPEDIKFLDEARSFAIEQANEAVFHSTDDIAKEYSRLVSNLRNSDKLPAKVLGLGLNVTQPFVKIPINVAKSVFAYSPLEFAKAITDAARHEGANKVIDDIAKGLTGTALFGVGIALGKAGLITSKADISDKSKGIQDYSLTLGNTNISLSNLPPVATILLAGASFGINNEDEQYGGWERLSNALLSMEDPIFETTMLQGLMDTLSVAKYTDNNSEIMQSIAGTMASNLMGQFVPSELGNISRALDNDRKSTYTDNNLNPLMKEISYGWNSVKNKIPGLNNILGTVADKIPSLQNTALDANQDDYDVWGNKKTNFDYDDGSALGTLLNLGYKHLSPVFINKVKETNITQFLDNLYQDTKDDELYPQEAKNKFNYDKSVYVLNERERSTYRKVYGETNTELVSSLINDERFNSLDAESKKDLLKEMYEVSKKVAESKIIGDGFETTNTNYNTYARDGVDALKDSLIAKYENNAIKEEMKNKGIPVTDKTIELYNNGDTEELDIWTNVQNEIYNKGYDFDVSSELITKRKELSNETFGKYLDYWNTTKEAKVDTSKNGWQAYQDGKFDKYVDEYLPTIKEYGATNTEKLYEAWSKGGINGLKKALEEKAAAKESKTASKDDNEVFEKYGLGKGASASWAKAQKEIPTLKREEFIDTYTEMDSYGNNNGSLSKDEIIAYLNAENIGYDEGMQLWSIYAGGNWKIPVLTNGTWKK